MPRRPDPHDFGGVNELIQAWGVTRARVSQIVLKPSFPPVHHYAGKHRIWWLPEVKAWSDSDGRAWRDPYQQDGHQRP